MDDELGVMAKPLVFRGVLTEDDLVDLWRYANRVNESLWSTWLAVGMAALVTVLLVAILAMQRVFGQEMSWFLLAAVAVLAFLWTFMIFGRFVLVAWLARRHYRRHGAKFLKTEVTMTADRVTVANADHRTEFRWSLVGLIGATPVGLLVCDRARRPMFWLPNRVLEDDGRRDDVLTLAEANGVRVRHFA